MPDDRLTAELVAIKEREQAATPGPWGTGEDENSWRLSGDLDTGFRPPCLIEAAKYSAYGPSYWPNEADAAFIVAARTDVPRLVAAVEAALNLADKYDAEAIREAIAGALTGAEGGSPCVLDAALAGSPGAPTLTATGRAQSPSCPASRRWNDSRAPSSRPPGRAGTPS